MIKPTVGRVVWFHPGEWQNIARYEQPLAATVAYVWSDRMVNLSVIDAQGEARPMTSVPLLQDDDTPPAAGFYCGWMPYQKGQAAKTEAAEAKADAAALDVSALVADACNYGTAVVTVDRLPPGAMLAEGFTESGPLEPIAGACSHPDIVQGEGGRFSCTSCGKVASRLISFRRESRSTAALG